METYHFRLYKHFQVKKIIFFIKAVNCKTLKQSAFKRLVKVNKTTTVKYLVCLHQVKSFLLFTL